MSQNSKPKSNELIDVNILEVKCEIKPIPYIRDFDDILDSEFDQFLDRLPSSSTTASEENNHAIEDEQSESMLTTEPALTNPDENKAQEEEVSDRIQDDNSSDSTTKDVCEMVEVYVASTEDSDAEIETTVLEQDVNTPEVTTQKVSQTLENETNEDTSKTKKIEFKKTSDTDILDVEKNKITSSSNDRFKNFLIGKKKLIQLELMENRPSLPKKKRVDIESLEESILASKDLGTIILDSTHKIVDGKYRIDILKKHYEQFPDKISCTVLPEDINPIEYFYNIHFDVKFFSAGQRACIAADYQQSFANEEDFIASLDGKGKTDTRDKLLKKFKVSVGYLKMAANLRIDHPEIFNEVLLGKTKIMAVDKEYRNKQNIEEGKIAKHSQIFEIHTGNPRLDKSMSILYDSGLSTKIIENITKNKITKLDKIQSTELNLMVPSSLIEQFETIDEQAEVIQIILSSLALLTSEKEAKRKKEKNFGSSKKEPRALF